MKQHLPQPHGHMPCIQYDADAEPGGVVQL